MGARGTWCDSGVGGELLDYLQQIKRATTDESPFPQFDRGGVFQPDSDRMRTQLGNWSGDFDRDGNRRHLDWVLDVASSYDHIAC